MKYIINNYTYYVGKNARENWNLLEAAEPFDIWFHLDKESSPYVILEIRDNNIVSKEVLLEGAKLCKKYSKLKNKTTCDVIYCSIENLKKGKVLGEVEIIGSLGKIVVH